MTEVIFSLNDGRKLSYAVYGPEDGKPVLYFHGTPSSRREPLLLQAYGIDIQALLLQANIRLIAPDRHAFTTFSPQRTFQSFAADALQLLQHFGVQQCPVLCWSGGGTYALAMAERYPGVVQGLYILCGFTRRFDRLVIRQMGLNKWYFLAARYVPLILRAGLNIVRRRKTTRLPPQKRSGLRWEDYTLLQKGLQQVAGVTLKEATRRGARSAVHEAASYFKNTGYAIGKIEQPIHYWWGTADRSVVEAHAKEVEQNAPNAVMHYREDEGHLSLYINAFAEALQVISHNHFKAAVAEK
jgi:pimeloyl-ACP methyl ester carboxylesterase